MKSFLVSLLIGAIVVAGSVFYTSRIEKVSGVLVKSNRDIINYLKEEDYKKAAEVTRNMAEYVDKEKLSLAIIMDHTDLDKIEMGLAELEGYVVGEVQTDALAKCSMIDVMLRHMPKNYKLKLENIL